MCLEGLVSGPAISARWGLTSSEIPDQHEAWQIIGHYISLLCLMLTLSVSPERIILGGGVLKQIDLFPYIRQALERNLNGYGRDENNLDSFTPQIMPPSLNGDAGVRGALALCNNIARQSLGP